MTSHEAAEIVSLMLTVPTVTTAVAVIVIYGGAAIEGLRAKKKSRNHWLIIGIAFGFVGAVLDNAYWSIPWTLEFFDHPSTNMFIMAGVYFNVPFRQGCGIAAAYCHLRGAIASGDKGDRGMAMLNVFLIANAVLSSGVAFILWWMK